MALPSLVLIPGLLNDAALWKDQVSDLADIARPYVADITKGETLAALARDVLAIAAPRFALAGFSLGGIVAQEIMRIAPERVTHLALLDTTMLADGKARAAERQRLIALAQNPGRFHGFGDKMLDSYLAPKNRYDVAMAASVRSMTERLGSEVFVRQSMIDRPDSRRTLQGLRCPTLVLCGEYDTLTPPQLHRDMAEAIPSSQLVILPDCGHLSPIEAPQAVSCALRGLLGRS